jgi:hypothetical protein
MFLIRAHPAQDHRKEIVELLRAMWSIIGTTEITLERTTYYTTRCSFFFFFFFAKGKGVPFCANIIIGVFACGWSHYSLELISIPTKFAPKS